jgi:hypothetical protein
MNQNIRGNRQADSYILYSFNIFIYFNKSNQLLTMMFTDLDQQDEVEGNTVGTRGWQELHSVTVCNFAD